MCRPKIGAVSYLNTKPLVAGLGHATDEFDVIFDLPSRLADRLAAGELDVALIPVIEAVTQTEYTIVSDACIACRGPVWSVKLMSRVAGAEIKSLSLDEGSRTSGALTRIFLHHQFGIQPDCRQLSIEEDWNSVESDAVLIIGDRAMKASSSEFPFVWDLGEAWFQWTSKPFVFAVWAARSATDLNRLDRILSSSRDRGLRELNEISATQAPRYGLSDFECLTYLQDNLHFNLGVCEKNGMDLYFRYAAELSLIPPTYRLEFHDCQTA